jgi:hypothetical protein
MRRSYWLPIILVGLASCEEVVEPRLDASPRASFSNGEEDSDLQFVQFSTSTPPATRDTSFWAVKGEDRELIVYFWAPPGAERGEKLLEFRVSEDALLRRPDGSRFLRGDSVQIFLHIDEERFEFDFEPSGLAFDPRRPAELKLSYGFADPDLDGDGAVSSDDKRTERSLLLWKQEAGETTWTSLLAKFSPGDDRMRADITGFTRFALASN